MTDHTTALTAYEYREHLPNLAVWMDDDTLKQLTLWQGSQLIADEEYFDLTNPERGPFLADGNEGPVTDRTYVARKQMTLRAWTQLITWRQPISENQGEALVAQEQALGIKPL